MALSTPNRARRMMGRLGRVCLSVPRSRAMVVADAMVTVCGVLIVDEMRMRSARREA